MNSVLLPLLFLTGCKVTDAPASLEDLVVYGFVHFDDDDTRILEEAVANLGPLVDNHSEDLDEGVRVEELRNADLAAAGVENADVEGIVGALGAVTYTSGLDDVFGVTAHSHKDDLFDNVLVYEVLDETDRDCFANHACDRFEQTLREVVKVPLLGEADRTFVNQFRWVQTDSGEALVIRSLSPEPMSFNSNIVKVHQQYAFVVLEDGRGGTERMESFWVDAEVIGLDVPDNYAVNNAINAMAEQAERIDEVIALQ
ncbi:MAG: hypothetical protein GWP91_00895 [Rhodobacterales bacterium]|nr:hypothetical protein [Rhodobacterales bacterium]